MRTSLMVMAAGIGARYGGNKQIDKMGPNDEMLMEYSIFDAKEAGFNRVVFVIRKDMEAIIRNIIGDRLSRTIEVAYAYQEFDSLPGGFEPPIDRVKPYGTVHALLCAKEEIHEPFAVINADDYYGKEAFSVIHHSLVGMASIEQASMVGYKLRNTVSEHGQVTRGICNVSALDHLTSIKETYKIALLSNNVIMDTENNMELDLQALVSMNFWGFTPWIFEQAERYMAQFLMTLKPEEQKKEYPLPVMLDQMIQAGEIQVEVLTTTASWFGVTYQEDKPLVKKALLDLHNVGAYPKTLF